MSRLDQTPSVALSKSLLSFVERVLINPSLCLTCHTIRVFLWEKIDDRAMTWNAGSVLAAVAVTDDVSRRMFN